MQRNRLFYDLTELFEHGSFVISVATAIQDDWGLACMTAFFLIE
jgi:hypothetical protein